MARHRSFIVVQLAAPAAVIASLLVASQALGAGWSGQHVLTHGVDGRAAKGGVVVTGPDSAAIVYRDDVSVVARTTDNGGASWSGPVLIGDGDMTWSPAAAGRGSDVDVVWKDAYSTRVLYRHSPDGGSAFGPTLKISHDALNTAWPDVARGDNGRVLVAWLDPDSNQVFVRVSKNGGVSFGPDVLVTSDATYNLPAVAADSGALYLAYYQMSHPTRIRVLRSVDDGATWKPKVTISGVNPNEQFALSASGDTVFVGYAALNGTHVWTRYIRSINRGASWAAPVNLSSRSGESEFGPYLAISGGKIRAMFQRCLDAQCSFDDGSDGAVTLAYRESADGVHWSALETVSAVVGRVPFPVGLGFAGRVMALYTSLDPSTGEKQAALRTR